MAPTNTDPNKKKSWAEINRTKKEERKKWKDKNLAKKSAKETPEEVPEKRQKVEKESTTNVESTAPSRVTAKKELSTLSIAVPGSIIENAQSAELRTYLAGQIARAACIFQVDEIVVFDDYANEANARKAEVEDNHGLKTARQCCVQLARILQYLECPQYLRKSFFPIHKDLKFSGLLNPLNTPHHLTTNEYFPFREGVVTNKPTKPGRGSIVNIGLYNDINVDKLLSPGLRCTVKLLPQEEGSKKLKGVIVSPNTPRLETGVYWGYTVRLATSLSQVFSQCPFKDGYDLTIGTSDKGTSVDEFECTPFKHVLIMFGGLQGLEAALENDEVLKVEDPKLLFDEYLNTLPAQGSKSIRTEEAILVTLAAIRPRLNPENKPIEFIEANFTNSEKPLNNGKTQSSAGQSSKEESVDLSKFD